MEQIDKVYPGSNANPIIFTGWVESDPTGRFQVGHHMRSSLIVKETKTKKGIKVETINSVYLLKGPPGDTMPDLGNAVLNLFY
jgi:hypothetical protein